MPIDTSIYSNVQPVKIDSPLNALAQVSQIRALQNQNQLFPLQLQQMQLQNQQNQQKFNMIQPILARMTSGQSSNGSGQGTNALAGSGPSYPTSAMPGTPGTPGPMPSIPTVPTNDGIPYSLEDLSKLALAGYPGADTMLKVKQAAMQGVSFDPGKTYNISGKVFTMPILGEGKQMGPDGSVMAIPGYSKTNAGIQGDQAGAVESAKNDQTLAPLDRLDPSTGRPYAATVGSLVRSVTPPQQGTQGAPQVQPMQGAGPDISNMSNGQIQQMSANPSGPIVQGQGGLDTSKMTPQQIAALAKADPTAFSNGIQAQQGSPQVTQDQTTQIQAHLANFPKMQQIMSGVHDQATYDAAKQQVMQLLGPQAASQMQPQYDPNVIAQNMQKAQVVKSQLEQQLAQSKQQPMTTPAQGGFNGFAGPADIAQSQADVALKNQPALKSATDVAAGDAKNFGEYKADLNKNVDSGYGQYMRNQQVRQLLTEYQTGLAAPDARSAFASNLKNSFPNNPGIQAFAEKVNGGNVGSGQELANLLSAAGLTNVIKVLDGNGRVNKAEYAALQEHAEKNTSDPSALLGIMGYQDNVYKQQLAEQQALANATKKGTLNPSTWNADYAQLRHDAQTPGSLPVTPGRTAAIPTGAVQMLKSNPAMREQFDQKYGNGASVSVLGK